MARILLGWELGSGLGHVATLLPIGKALAAQGHEIVFVLQNIVETWPLLRDCGFAVLQAPVFFASGDGGDSTVSPTRSYADILVDAGYDNIETLEPVVRAWRHLLDSIKPDLIVGEHAPTLSLAGYGFAPVINVGTGFEIAHWEGEQFTVLNDRAVETVPVLVISNTIETVLRRLGQVPPIPAIRAVFGAQTFVAAFAEIDPYRAVREAVARGPLWPLPAQVSPLPDVAACLVYLPADHPELAALIQGLKNISMPGLIYVRNASAALREALRDTALQVSETPVDLDVVLPQVSVVLHHGGAGMTQRCLAHGRPQVIAPIHMEQKLTSSALQEMGVAIKLGGIFSPEQSGAALEQAVSVPRLAQLAQYHASHLQKAYPQVGSLAEFVATCLAALPQHLRSKRAESIAFVTTCKGRLHHLQQTLPLMLAEQPDQMIVVDYGCPQGTANWVEKHFPADKFPCINVLRVTDDPGFSVSRARNLGYAATTAAWVAFVDADICVQPGWLAWIRNHLNGTDYFLSPTVTHPTRENAGTYGSVVIRRAVFDSVDGYDEVFRGWGSEDADLYFRLEIRHHKAACYPQAFLKDIPHGNDERSQFYHEKDIHVSLLIAQYYRAVKYALMQLEGEEIPLQSRMELMQLVEKQIEDYQDNPEAVPEIATEFLMKNKVANCSRRLRKRLVNTSHLCVSRMILNTIL